MDSERVNIATGTCFFIRQQDRLFFVTAKHVLAGCRDDNSKNPNFPDTMHVILHSGSNLNTGNIGFTSKEITDTIDCNKITASPDIIVLEFEDQVKDVYSVDSFLSTPSNNAITFVLFGFPGTEMYKGSPHFAAASKIYGEQSRNWQLTNDGVVDTVNYYLFANTSDNLDGFSGSPVFIRERKTDKWQLVGILVASTASKEPKQVLKICKIGYVMKEIEKLLGN